MLISGRPSVLKCFSALSANSVVVIFDASLDSFIVKKNAHSKERYNCDHPCYYNNYPCILYQYTLAHILKLNKNTEAIIELILSIYACAHIDMSMLICCDWLQSLSIYACAHIDMRSGCPRVFSRAYQYTLAHILIWQKCANFDSIFMHKHILLTRTTSCEIYSLLD